MSGIDLFSPFILAQLQQDPTLLDSLIGGGTPPDAAPGAGGDPMSVLLGNQPVSQDAGLAQQLGINLLGRETPLTRMAADVPPGSTLPPLPTTETIPEPPPPGRAPLMTQAQQQDEARRLGLRTPFPPEQRFNSRGEAISPDLSKPNIGGAAGGEPDLGTAKISPETLRSFAEANAKGRNPPVEPLPYKPTVVPSTAPPGSVPGPPMPLVPPRPAAPRPAAPGVASGAPPPMGGLAPEGSGVNTNALMRFLMQGMMRNRQNDIYDKILELGLGMMASKNPSLLGQVGEGGLLALKSGRERESAEMKNVLEGAQVANVLAEADTRQGKLDLQKKYLAGYETLARREKAGGGAGAPASGEVGMGSNQTLIYNRLVELGHEPWRAAAAVGWGTGESGRSDANPAIEGPYNEKTGMKPLGWQQWLDRRPALEKFAAERGGSATDPLIQADFFDAEMRGTSPGAGELARNAYWNATDVDSAIKAMAHFSRTDNYKPDSPESSRFYASRLNAAKSIFNRVSGGSGQTGPAPAAAGAGGDPNTPVEPGESAPGGMRLSPGVFGAPIQQTGTASRGISPGEARYMGIMASQLGDSAGAKYWLDLATPPPNFAWRPDGSGAVDPIPGSPADLTYQAAQERIKAAAQVIPQLALKGWGVKPDGTMAYIIGGPESIEYRTQRARAEAEATVDAELNKQGFRKSADGTWSFTPGLAKDPESIQREKAAGARGERSITEPSDIRIQAANQNAIMNRELVTNAALQQAIGARERQTAAEAPLHVPAGQSVFLLPGSVAAERLKNFAKNGGTLPEGTKIHGQDGSVEITSSGAVLANKLAESQVTKFETKTTAAQAAADSLVSLQTARQIIDKGIYAGRAGPFKQRVGEWLQELNYNYSKDAVANTDAFFAELGHQVAQMTKVFGTNPSDADREAIQAMIGAKRNITEQSIRQIMDVADHHARIALGQYNDQAKYFQPYSNIPLTIQVPNVPPINFDRPSGATPYFAPTGRTR
jgi:Phage tail lysozyme